MPHIKIVLIVDDDPVIHQLLETYVRSIGAVTVLHAENGNEATRILDQQGSDIDLIFCDLEMPEMDGIEILNHLQAIGFQGAIAIISGAHWSVVESAAKLATLHGLNYLGRFTKPPTRATLDQLIAAAT